MERTYEVMWWRTYDMMWSAIVEQLGEQPQGGPLGDDGIARYEWNDMHCILT